MYTGAREP